MTEERVKTKHDRLFRHSFAVSYVIIKVIDFEGGSIMRIDELYTKLNELGFIENYYVVNKKHNDEPETERVLKIYDDEFKLAEIYIDKPYMLRTSYGGFDARNPLEKQALLKILVEFASTPVNRRQSELYFAYYNDLNNISHYIKRLSNGRLTDEMIPMAYFRTLNDEQLNAYLFNTAEFDDFPKDYQPRFTPDSFVKVRPYEEMIEHLEGRYPHDDE